MAELGAQLVQRWQHGLGQQENFRQTWQDLAEFFTPYKANITRQDAPGTRKTTRLFDSSAVMSATTLSSNIQGTVCNQAQEWFSVRIRDSALNELKPVRDWCEVVSERTLAALSASNFYQELSEVFVDLPVFAIGGLFCDENPPLGPNRWGGLHYVATVIGHYIVEEDAQGRIDTVIRTFELPARAIAAHPEWGATCSDAVREKGKDPVKGSDLVKLLHATYPRNVYAVGSRAAKGKRFASCYVEHDSRTLLSEGGYDENPYAIARWSKDSASAYGWGPGSLAYPDVRTLNRYVELDLQARGKVVDPPILQRHDAVLGSLSLEPASINIVMAEGPLGDSVMPFESKARFDVNKDGIDRLERKISECFFGPLLRQITKDMTATEAWIIQDETLRLLGPAAGRMQLELLGATIERTIAVLARAHQLPPPPDELVQAAFNADLDIVYEGPLARAQRSRDLVAIERKNAWLLGLAQWAPEIAHRAAQKFDWDAEAAHVAEVTGYPSDLVLDDAAVKALRENQAQGEAAQQQLQMIGGAAQAAGQAAPMVKALSDAQAQQAPQPGAAA